jgi:NAD(P)-dependent dehydrogenase (short-subunit alcohol dehydrogenase family)
LLFGVRCCVCASVSAACRLPSAAIPNMPEYRFVFISRCERRQRPPPPPRAPRPARPVCLECLCLQKAKNCTRVPHYFACPPHLRFLTPPPLPHAPPFPPRGFFLSSYADSKLAAVLFSVELNRRYGKDGLRSIAVNPGAVNSDIWRKFEVSSPKLKRYVLDPLFRALYLDTQQGATCSIAAAVADWGDDVLYLQPYWFPKKSLIPHSPEYAGGVR